MSNETQDWGTILANYPVMAPPAVTQSNFNNPQTDGKIFIIVGVLFAILPVIAVLMRLFTRKYISKQSLWWYDGICVLAVLGSITITTLMIKTLQYGLGKHLWDIRALDMTPSRLVALLVTTDVVTFTAYLVRISILLLYYRLFSIYETSLRMIRIGMAICTLVIIPNLGVIITRETKCTSASAVLKTFCQTRTISTYIVIFDALNVMTDFFIFMIAIQRFRCLHLELAKKRKVLLLFAAGFLACSLDVVQVVWICIHFSDPDTLRYALWVGLFAILEVDIALVCNCAIFFPAFWNGRPWASLSSRSDPTAGDSKPILKLELDNFDASGQKSNNTKNMEALHLPES